MRVEAEDRYIIELTDREAVRVSIALNTIKRGEEIEEILDILALDMLTDYLNHSINHVEDRDRIVREAEKEGKK